MQGSFKPLLSIMPVQSASFWPRMTGASAGEGKTYVCLPPCTHSLAGDSNKYSRPVASIFISTVPRILHHRKATGLKHILFILAVGLIGFLKTFIFSRVQRITKIVPVLFFFSLLMKYRVCHALGLIFEN